MVDLSKLSGDLRGRIEKIMAGDGQDAKKVDSRNEYNQLAGLLSGDGKVSGAEKAFVEGMLVDYQEEFMVRDEVKQRVRDLIKNGESKKADDGAEINDLKDYKKTKGLTKEEKIWIQAVIDGREVKNSEATKKAEGTKNTDTPKANEGTKNTENAENNAVATGSNKGKKGGNIPKDNVVTEDTKKNFPSRKDAFPRDKFPPKKNPFPRTARQFPPNVVNDNDMVGSNNGNINQGGVGNVNIGGDVNINIVEPQKKSKTSNKHIAPKPGNTDAQKNLTPREIKEARNDGEVVADKLFGYTNNSEQKVVQDIVNKEIDSNNVVEFFRGYEEKLAEETKFGWDDIALGIRTAAKYNKDHFFEQMRTEWDFPEKQELMHKVANDLQTYLANKYGVNSTVAKEVAVILLEKTFGEKQAEKLDKIVQQELE